MLPALSTFAVGVGLGILVAAEVGPIWLLCARTALHHGFRPAIAIGAGAALVDLFYASLGVAGAAALLAVTGFRLALGLLGAAVLIFLGARTILAALRLRRTDGEEHEMRAVAAFRMSLVATAANPLTVASWSAIFAGLAGAGLTRSPVSAVLLLAGIGTGSLGWFTLLSAGLSAVGRRLPPRALVAVDLVSGAGLVGFGALLLARVV